MVVKITRCMLLWWTLCLPIQALFSQHSSKDNYSGAWELPSSWNPTWNSPQSNVSNSDITIFGFITVNGDLSFSGSSGKLIVNDTLVITGNLSIGNNNEIKINDNGVLIVRGDLSVENKIIINSNGYLIIAKNFSKSGNATNGTFTSNDNPVKVFVGGTISPPELINNNPLFPALNCTSPVTTRYAYSNCSFGNTTDLMNDPIYPFFNSTCVIQIPTITAGGATVFCDGNNVTLTSSGGKSYLWSTGEMTNKIIVTKSGNYSVKVTNAEGCQSAASAVETVTVNALPSSPAITANGSTSFCQGDHVILTSSAEKSYLWSTGANTQSITISSAGSYSVQVTDKNGCKSAISAPTTVIVNALPTVNAGNDKTILFGTITTINATVSGTGPFTYSWSPTSQLVNALVQDPTTKIMTATTLFTLTATSTTTSCSKQDTIKISTIGNILSSTASVSVPTICAGSITQLQALASGGTGIYTYTWTSVPAGFTSSVANPIVSPLSTTTYKVAIFDRFSTVNSQVTVNVNPLPTTLVISASGPTTFCQGGNVTLTSSAGLSYLWSDEEITQAISSSTSGNYTVQTIDANGCKSNASSPIVITVNDIPITPTITTSGPTAFCEDGTVTLTSSLGTSYSWSNTSATANIDVKSSGSYSVQVTNSSGCQSSPSVAVNVIVNPLPAIPTITASGHASLCEGESVVLNSSAGLTYLWSNGSDMSLISISSSGSYTVQTTNANGCQSLPSAATVVTVNALPLVNITSSNSMCVNVAKTLSGTPSGGVFTLSGGQGSISENALSASGVGIIYIVYTYSNGCSNKATQSISVTENPVSNAGPDQELNYTFESQMSAQLAKTETGEWSIVSGSGKISDIHSPMTTVTNLSLGDNQFLWKVGNGSCESGSEVKITVLDLFIPSVITPNNDGKNDYFIISKLSGTVELMIFNRWGNEEFSNNNYLNDWNGVNNKGKPLPNDTYFYIVKFENGTVKKGSVLIKK